MIPRFMILTIVALLICGIVVMAPTRARVQAQDTDDDWP